MEELPKRQRMARVEALKNGLVFDEKRYEYKEDFVPASGNNIHEIHTTSEMITYLERNPKCQLDARVLGMSSEGRGMVKMNRTTFLEHAKKKDSKRLRESFDGFLQDDGGNSWGANGAPIGHDFTPLLGGPFNKQLYYRDYLRMISSCFFAYHHDPIARAIVNCMTDFTMGRGFQLVTTGKDKDQAQILWNAFKAVNELDSQFDHVASETSIYGEVMLWWLPGQETRISFQPQPGERIPTGLIPRIRLIDPSNIAEIITIPEDIVKGVLCYVWLAPTQYNMFSDGKQPNSKFIYTQIPADQIRHFKVNAVSNEKRGRSDFFPALGYMKRLRDAINYSLVSVQKSAAWSIDTTVKGNDQDIDDYVNSQKAMGMYPPAGSEFVHTDAITRQYLANQGTAKAGGDAPVFNWCLSMISMATGIPVSYLGTHLHVGSSRASALVSTEPVAKRFERRRVLYEKMIRTIYTELMQRFGLNADCDVIFPELITQDRSAKLQDLMLSQSNSWISHERAATNAAKEMDIKDFDYREEMIKIKADDAELGISPASMNPLTAPGQAGQTEKVSALTSPEKKQVKDNLRKL